jgi:hypothetical protein
VSKQEIEQKASKTIPEKIEELRGVNPCVLGRGWSPASYSPA